MMPAEASQYQLQMREYERMMKEQEEARKQAMEQQQMAEAQRRIQQVVLGDVAERPDAYQGQGAAAKLMKYGFDPKQLSALGLGSGSEAPANVREWDHYSQLSPDQQRQYLEMKRAAQMMNLGDRYAVRDPVSNQAAGIQGGQIQLGPNETPDYLGQAGFASQAGAEAATNAALPDRTAIENAAAEDKAKSARSRENGAALAVYETAMGGLMEGLGGANTGPIAGRLPAVTADQQVAEGAVSAMAPVLKSIFRVAGEGTFTDKDQALLLDMLPTRKDLPEARAAKLRNVDAIVRAKLGQAEQQEAPPAPAQKRGVYNPQTGKIEWQ